MRQIDILLNVLRKLVKRVLALPRGLGVLAERAVRALARRLHGRLSVPERERLLSDPRLQPEWLTAVLVQQWWAEMRALPVAPVAPPRAAASSIVAIVTPVAPVTPPHGAPVTPPRPQAGRLASRAQDMWLREHRAELQRIM